MKILIVTDAWNAQTNGVVTTLRNLIDQLDQRGHTVKVFSAEQCNTSFRIPFYTEIQVGVPSKKEIMDQLSWKPDVIHIVTMESPLGFLFARHCDRNSIPYTASYHTNFPEYLNRMLCIPAGWLYPVVRKLYAGAQTVLSPSHSCTHKLLQKGFHNVITWSRGVDRGVFSPDESIRNSGDRKRVLCVSRISTEKNLEAFFWMRDPDWDLVMVGDGPQLEEYRGKYPHVEFTGKLVGYKLAQQYQQADVFVFPSKTDTFGLVMIEALACGTPVIAYDVEGPKDIVQPHVGSLREYDLEWGVRTWFNEHPEVDHAAIAKFSEKWSWETCADQFLEHSVQVDWQ